MCCSGDVGEVVVLMVLVVAVAVAVAVVVLLCLCSDGQIITRGKGEGGMGEE